MDPASIEAQVEESFDPPFGPLFYALRSSFLGGGGEGSDGGTVVRRGWSAGGGGGGGGGGGYEGV